MVYTVNAEAVADAAAPRLSRALDELTVLGHQLEASERDETVTLLLEVVGPASPEAVAKFAASLPPMAALVLAEDTAGAWREPHDGARRRAAVFHGPGVRRMLRPWFGYGRVEVAGEHGVTRRALVRCVPLEGGDGTPEGARAALSAWDERMKAEREARRRGAPAWGEGQGEGETLLIDHGRFVSTGLELTRAAEHLAACLRGGG
jgi:hypothetical protein